MSEQIRFCFEDEDTQEVGRKMSDWAVRRLPVLNRDKRLVGIVSLGDLATGGAEEESRKALEEISDAPPGSAAALIRGSRRRAAERPPRRDPEAFGIPNDIQARTRTGAALGCRIRITCRRGT